MSHYTFEAHLKALSHLPEFLTVNDLIALGLAGSHSGLATERRQRRGLPFIKIGGRIRYPRQAVLELLKQKMKMPRESASA